VPLNTPITGPAIDDFDGLVYVIVTNPSGGFDLERFDLSLQNPEILYHGSFAYNSINPTPLIVGSDGTVYFSDGITVIAVGPKKWISAGQPFAGPCFGNPGYLMPALSQDGTVYAMCQPGGGSGFGSGMYAFEANSGTEIHYASYSRGGTEPIIDSLNHIRAGFQAFNGAIFCGDYTTWDNNLTPITPGSSDCDSSKFSTSRAALLPDGVSTVRIGYSFGAEDDLVAEGANSWIIYADSQSIPFFTSVPATDAQGTIYVSTAVGIDAQNPIDGSSIWSFTTGDRITTQPAIASDGTLYVGSDKGNVYAFSSIPEKVLIEPR
jgi:outer membrane protein assembly factor BamB